ncbi:MAG: polysaccharide deacetylase family protein [Solirubrobacteraceae bacterium]
MARYLLAIQLLVFGVLGVLSGAAGAQTAPKTPFPVRSSSLSQAGQDVVWSVQLAHSFSPGALGRQHRSLCLLIKRPGNGSVAGQVCVLGPRRGGSTPRVEYMPISARGPGAAVAMAATVTRPHASELTASFLPTDAGWKYGALRWQVLSAVSTTGCTGPAQGRVGCYALFPAKPTPARLHTPQLIGCVPAGPSLVFGGPSTVREIALTFDDGPWGSPPTISFINLLAREHVPATFFEIGRQISQFDPTGSLERLMLAGGDMIGDHTWSHPQMNQLSPAAQTSQLELTANAIRRATGGFTPCLWRPPYGATNPQLESLARSLGLITVVWDVDPRDWALPGVGAIYSNVVGNARSGAIVLQHFGGGPRYETLQALPQEIATLRSRGYKFVTVAQLLGLRLIYK